MRFPPVLFVLFVGAPLARTATLPRTSEGPEVHVTSTQLLQTSSTAVGLVQNSYPSRANGRPEPGPELKMRGRARKATPAKKTSRPTATADAHPTNFLPVSTKATANNPNPPSTSAGFGGGSQSSAASSGSGGNFTSGSQCTVSRRTQTGLVAAVAALALLLAIALIALVVLWRRLSSRRTHDGPYLPNPRGRNAPLYAPVYVSPLEDGGLASDQKSMA